MASKAVGLLTFNFGANMKGFEKAMNKAEKKLKKFGSNLKKTGKSMTMGLTLPIVAMGVASVKAFDTQAKAQAKLTTALGGSETAMKSLVSQAKELQKTTLFGDEETIEAQSMLAMMGLQEDAILKLTPLIQDMATAKGMDLVTASDLVAKSLGSSTNALSRYGITITGAVGSNERLNTAVTELTTKFEGQAKVAATAGAGSVTQLTNQLGDLGEEIGMRLMPYVKDFVSWAQKMINKFDGLSEETKDSIVKWALYVAAIGPALMAFGKIVTGVGAVIKIIRTLSAVLAANPYAAVVAVVVALTLAMKNLRDSYITTVSAAESLQRVESVASRNIAEDISNIELLTGIIEDETTALEDKQSALETLKSTYPGYYTEIDNTFKSTKALTDETTRLKGEMMDIAMFEAAKEMIVDVAKEIIDLQADMKAGQGLYWYEPWKTASGDNFRKMGREQDKSELKRLQNHLQNVTKLYKDLGKDLGMDITEGLAEPSAIVGGGAIVGGDTGDDGGTDDAEKLLQDSLDRTIALEQEYSLLRTGIHLDEMGRKHAQSIAALEMERDNMLSNVEDTDNAEKEKDAIRELYNQKISDQLDANDKELGGSQEDQRAEWDKTFEHIEKGYKQVASVINQVFAGIGKAVSAVQDKQQAEFDNWKANEDKKLEKLDEKKEKEMEQLTESNEFKVMSQEEQDAALLGLEEKFADQSDAIKDKVARKEKALKLKQAKTNKRMKMFDAIIGTASAVVNALGSAPPPLNFILAALVGVLGGIQIAAIASTPLPAMAKGGLVTGPTTALVGEGMGTNMSNPEVIAPLDKLKGMMGNQTVEVFGKISGTDIVLSSNQTNINRLRSI